MTVINIALTELSEDIELTGKQLPQLATKQRLLKNYGLIDDLDRTSFVKCLEKLITLKLIKKTNINVSNSDGFQDT